MYGGLILMYSLSRSALPCLLGLLIVMALHGQQLLAEAPAALSSSTMQAATDWKVISQQNGSSITPIKEGQRLLALVPTAGAKPWETMLHSPPISTEIKKGQVLWLGFTLQSRGTAESCPRVSIYLHPYRGKGVKHHIRTQAYAQETPLGETWTADADYPADSLNLAVHFAEDVGEVEVGPLTLKLYAAEVKPDSLPATPLTYSGREPDAAWRVEADKRIKKHRMSLAKVTVQQLEGQPVPEAEIHWHQEKHAFGFGTFVESPALKNTPDGEKYREQIKDLFNYATVGAYLAEWGWLKEEGRAQSLRIADWLVKQNIPARGHLLVYPGYTATPRAWQSLPAEERRTRMEAHFTPVLKGLGERGITEFDMINELRDNIGFCNELAEPSGKGGLQLVSDWFKQAHKLSPKASLFINEYWILAGGGQTLKEQNLYHDTITQLLKYKAPLHGIGLQGHFGSSLTPPARVLEILDRFAKFGKKIRITEFDIDIGDEAAQADYTRDFYHALYSHPKVEGIVQWGFWEGAQWKKRAAMFRKDWTPKPNYHAYRKLIKETLASHHQAKTDENGNWEQLVHRGTHRVTIKVGKYEVTREVEVTNKPAKILISVP
jgi:endo-1,4-beta-xylanase